MVIYRPRTRTTISNRENDASIILTEIDFSRTISIVFDLKKHPFTHYALTLFRFESFPSKILQQFSREKREKRKECE